MILSAVLRGSASAFSQKLLLVTQGKAGVQALFQQQHIHFPARPVVSVDTTGAGDAFVAGLLASLAAHGFPEDVAALEPIVALAQNLRRAGDHRQRRDDRLTVPGLM